MMRAAAVCLLWIALTTAGCAPNVDLTSALRIQPVISGWVDDGPVQGKKKIVPTISVSVKNASGRTLQMLQLNALFRRIGDEDEWGTHLLTVAGAEGLPAGGMTTVSLKSPQGYTSTEPTRDMLANSQFIDGRVDIYAKYGAAGWTHVGQFRIAHQLLAR